MIRINLLSEGKRPAAVRRSAVPLGERDWTHISLVIAALVLVAGGAVYWWWLSGQRAQVAEEVAEAQAEVERLAPILAEVEEFKVKQEDLERKISTITTLKDNQTGPVRLMDAVSRALPDLLWLDSMRVSGNTIQMSGRAFNVSAISNFVENLGRVPEFDEPQGVTADEAGRVYRFSLRVGYSLAPPPASADEDGLEDDKATDAVAAGG